jgi:hypothetical protein
LRFEVAVVTGSLISRGPLSVERSAVSVQVPSGRAVKVSRWCALKPVVAGSSPRIFSYVRVVVSVTWTVAMPPRIRVLFTVTSVSAAL